MSRDVEAEFGEVNRDTSDPPQQWWFDERSGVNALEVLCAALLMRAVQYLPRSFRMDSDGTTYAWYDLAYITGYDRWEGYLAEPEREQARSVMPWWWRRMLCLGWWLDEW